jgi:hypothetical protein
VQKLYGFCTPVKDDQRAKLLILLEQLAAVQFLRGFWKKRGIEKREAGMGDSICLVAAADVAFIVLSKPLFSIMRRQSEITCKPSRRDSRA